MKYIYHHLGLGDHIICNGLIRSLINESEEYKMFVKSHNLDTVKFMYKDLTNLSFIVGDDQFVIKYVNDNKINTNNIIIAGFKYIENAKEFDEGFYIQNNVPFMNRWTNFKCERDIESEKKLFNLYNIKENEYVFIHDDESRGFSIDESYIVNKNLPVIRPKVGLTTNSFDYCYLMQNSIESHFIDSSFRLIFDSLQLRNDNLFYHINLKNNKIKDPYNKSQSILNFKII